MKTRAKLFIGIIILVAILSGVVAWNYSKKQLDAREIPQPATTVNLGFNYLNITSGLSAYYNLGTDCGALVTEVVPGSPADSAGIRAGDVILSFNGTKIDDGVSLLGLMRTCSAGVRIPVEIWRENSLLVEEVIAVER